MGFDFTGKKFLVTGATRGIGRDLTKAICEAGGQVYALGRQKELLDSLATECKNVIDTIAVDLGDWDATRSELEKLEPVFGLVNNAAVSFGMTPSVDVSKEIIDKTFAVNVMAAVNVTQVMAKKMIAAGNGGSIVNVSSICGLQPMRECMAYDMSKAALDMMTKQYAMELGPSNIRVNSANPTVVLTDLAKKFWSESVKAGKLKGQTPLGRFAEVSEVVGPIMYLLSDYSTMVTGTMNPIEGGLLSNISV